MSCESITEKDIDNDVFEKLSLKDLACLKSQEFIQISIGFSYPQQCWTKIINYLSRKMCFIMLDTGMHS